MALKAVVESLDSVPENARGLYKQEGNKFVLDLEPDSIRDHPSTGPLARALEREKEEKAKLKADMEKAQAEYEQYKGIDPEKARKALKQLDEMADKKLLDEGNVEELVQQRTERMRRELEEQLALKDAALEEMNAKIQQSEGRLAETLIFGSIKDAALKAGAREEALEDIVNRGKSYWKLEDGKPVAYKPGTEDKVFGKSGDLLTIDEWVTGLSKEANYLFKENTGGGSAGDGRPQQSGSIRMINRQAAGENLEAIAAGEAQIAD